MSEFELVGGIGIMGFLSPMDTEDTYAVIDPLYGIDGLRNVDSVEDLNNISFERRRAGMIVGVSGGFSYYCLKDIIWSGQLSDWYELQLNILNIDRETPSGLIDGINKEFLLSHTPIMGSDHIYLNGLLQDSGIDEDYTINDNMITFNEAPYPGMKIKCSYRYKIF
jgi:hypothetical protein